MPAIRAVIDSSSPAAAEAARLLWPKTISGPPGGPGARSREQARQHAGGDERGHGLQQRRVQADRLQDDERARDLGADHQHHQRHDDRPLARVGEHVEAAKQLVGGRIAGAPSARQPRPGDAGQHDQHRDPPGELRARWR